MAAGKLSKILDGFCSTEKTSPTATAMSKENSIRQTSMEPQPNAAAVLKMTIGFKTGAAKRKATPADIGKPLWNSRRVKGITPHSQTGKTSPINAPVTAAGRERFEMKRVR